MHPWPPLLDYRRALEQLPLDRPLTPDDAIALLETRDRLAQWLDQPPRPALPELDRQLQRLDRQLKGWGDRILAAIDLTTEGQNRWPDDARRPWWWSFEPSPDHWRRFDPFFNVLGLVCLTGSTGLIVDIAAKFFVPGVDLLGSIAVAGQSAIALITGRTLVTETGQTALKRWLIRQGIRDRYWQEVGALGSFALLIGLIGVRQVGFPGLAAHYTRLGEQAYRDNRLATAGEAYERALLFQPDAIAARYLTGRLADEMNELESAQHHYRLVLKNVPERPKNIAQNPIKVAENELKEWQFYLQAASNLSRVHLVKKEPEQAAVVAQRALRMIEPLPDDPAIADGRYGLHKNLGWARFVRGRYTEAEDSLAKASALGQTAKRDDRAAAAHCLMAKTLDGLGDYRPAIANWEQCAAHAAQLATPEGDAWQGQAGDRLENPQADPPKLPTNLAY